MHTEITYILYVIVSVALTVWVARTIHRNGRIFLVDATHGHEDLADSINHLLVIGFYLVNIGYVTLALKFGDKPGNFREAIEFLSTKIGLVLVVLGVMHFFNLFVISRMRQRAMHQTPHDSPKGFVPGPPPVAADSHM